MFDSPVYHEAPTIPQPIKDIIANQKEQLAFAKSEAEDAKRDARKSIRQAKIANVIAVVSLAVAIAALLKDLI